MSECRSFSEWFRACHEVVVLYRSCYDACTSLAKLGEDVAKLIKCHDECENEAVEHGKKHGLSEIETKMCLYML